MRKKIISFAAAAFLLVSAPLQVQAEEFYGGEGWSVAFNGSRMESTFKSTDIDDAVYQLQPGDTVNLSLSLENDYDGTADWYMSNQVLQSLEDSQSVAEGGSYSYVLTYIDSKGDSRQLYNSEAVGGEAVNESGEGLHQATDSLKNFFYLDQLEPGAAGKIALTVKLEGETQGNEYQDTLAKLQMNFAVEPAEEEDPLFSLRRKIIKTGDNTNILIFVWTTLIAGMVCGGLAISRLYRKRQDAGRQEKRRPQ